MPSIAPLVTMPVRIVSEIRCGHCEEGRCALHNKHKIENMLHVLVL